MATAVYNPSTPIELVRLSRINQKYVPTGPDVDFNSRDKWLLNDVDVHGIRIPISIDRDYTVIEGRRRFAAAVRLGITSIPTFMHPRADGFQMSMALGSSRMLFMRVVTYRSVILDLIEREEAGCDYKAVEDDWLALTQALDCDRETLVEGTHIIGAAVNMAQVDNARATRIMSTLRNHGVRPALEVLALNEEALA